MSAATTGTSWTCPACDRRVPAHVGQCRCGRVRSDSDGFSRLGDAPVQSHNVFLVKTAAALVIAAGATGGAIWYARSSPPAPAARAQVERLPILPAPSVGVRSPEEAGAPAVATLTAPAPATESAAAVPIAPAPAAPPSSVSGTPMSLEDLVARVSPAVVIVETSVGRGSGVFVRPDTVITNAHVAGSDLSVRVRRASGDVTTARVETVARDLDLAVLRLSSAPAEQAIVSLGTAGGIRAGQEVVAIGSALGVLQNTVTRGIVSGVRQAGGVTLIQTDAAINPGNSGGPLVDRQGNVIGINTMGVASAQGISFAVSVDHVRELLGGQHTTLTSATPASSLNQTLTGRTESDTDTSRERAASLFDQIIGQLARKADALDDYWRRFRSTCYRGQIAGGFDREWFALFDARAMRGTLIEGCNGALSDAQQQANAVRDGVVAADEAARRADVYPGTRRDILKRYRLDYPAWHP
jgi:hypothetical protein